ncbi:MAG: molybdopterin molybdotransferase MoeA [Bacteroidetes bacterium]|nr:molybdopterin molybdotransferase MoeA [Bacteroidota bacterium]
MILFEDALKTVLSQEYIFAFERVELSDSLGRILAEDIFSDMDMPPFDKSAVDGYACHPADLANLIAGGKQPFVTLQLIETIPAGTIPNKTILPGQCSKIMTGAMVPAGAHWVVMVEDTEKTGEDQVQIKGENTSKNICYRGENVTTGDLVLPKGTLITPANMAVLASVGSVNPLVAKLPRVGIISTGDELVEPGITPGIAQIRNSNATQLEAQVRTIPAQPACYGIVSDESQALREIIDRSLAHNDVVLLTGGVSMGDFDFVPAVMQEAGIEILFKSIAIQPGKPTVFGRRNNTFIFGLPGNPVSSFVLFEMMVRPFLHRMMGYNEMPMELKLPMGVDYSRRKSVRKSMIPVIIRDGVVFPVEYHGSAHINAYSAANGIMLMEIGTTIINKGEQVYVRPL